MKLRIVATGAFAMLGAVGVLAQSTKNAPPVHLNLDEPSPSAKKNPSVNPNAPAKPEAKPAAPAMPPAAKAEPGKAAAKADPNAPAKKDGKKKEDEMGKIEGLEIARGSGFLGLQIVNGTFKLSFYDAKKKPVAPDVASGAFRWNVNYQKMPERTILSPSGTALVSDKTVKPPYSFKLFVTLFKQAGGGADGSDAGAESFTVDFSQGG